jgi:hypothetical protein
MAVAADDGLKRRKIIRELHSIYMYLTTTCFDYLKTAGCKPEL